jgi:hypothetical protein
MPSSRMAPKNLPVSKGGKALARQASASADEDEEEEEDEEQRPSISLLTQTPQRFNQKDGFNNTQLQQITQLL